MASRRGITTMFLTARRLRLLLRIFLALLLVLSVLLATAFYLLQRNPEALTRHYLDGISARTGLIFCVEAVDVVLLPRAFHRGEQRLGAGKGPAFLRGLCHAAA